jgi:cytochrome oxidase complex assembly protein 1
LSEAPATPGPLPPPPARSGHGCLWGCLIAVLIVAAMLVVGVGYMGWFFVNGFKDDATLKTVMVRVNADQTARAVLGDDIKVEGISSVNINDTLATGKHADYVVTVKGTKATGTLAADVEVVHGKTTIEMLVLTGPDGHRYDLSGASQTAPPNNNSI